MATVNKYEKLVSDKKMQRDILKSSNDVKDLQKLIQIWVEVENLANEMKEKMSEVWKNKDERLKNWIDQLNNIKSEIDNAKSLAEIANQASRMNVVKDQYGNDILIDKNTWQRISAWSYLNQTTQQIAKIWWTPKDFDNFFANPSLRSMQNVWLWGVVKKAADMIGVKDLTTQEKVSSGVYWWAMIILAILIIKKISEWKLFSWWTVWLAVTAALLPMLWWCKRWLITSQEALAMSDNPDAIKTMSMFQEAETTIGIFKKHEEISTYLKSDPKKWVYLDWNLLVSDYSKDPKSMEDKVRNIDDLKRLVAIWQSGNTSEKDKAIRELFEYNINGKKLDYNQAVSSDWHRIVDEFVVNGIAYIKLNAIKKRFEDAPAYKNFEIVPWKEKEFQEIFSDSQLSDEQKKQKLIEKWIIKAKQWNIDDVKTLWDTETKLKNALYDQKEIPDIVNAAASVWSYIYIDDKTNKLYFQNHWCKIQILWKSPKWWQALDVEVSGIMQKSDSQVFAARAKNWNEIAIWADIINKQNSIYLWGVDNKMKEQMLRDIKNKTTTQTKNQYPFYQSGLSIKCESSTWFRLFGVFDSRIEAVSNQIKELYIWRENEWEEKLRQFTTILNAWLRQYVEWDGPVNPDLMASDLTSWTVDHNIWNHNDIDYDSEKISTQIKAWLKETFSAVRGAWSAAYDELIAPWINITYAWIKWAVNTMQQDFRGWLNTEGKNRALTAERAINEWIRYFAEKFGDIAKFTGELIKNTAKWLLDGVLKWLGYGVDEIVKILTNHPQLWIALAWFMWFTLAWWALTWTLVWGAAGILVYLLQQNAAGTSVVP